MEEVNVYENLETHLGRTISEVKDYEDDPSKLIRLIVGIAGEPIASTKKNGGEYLDVPIMDRTGQIKMRVWDSVDAAKERFTRGSIWSIFVTKGSWNDNPQITFKPGNSVRIASSIDDLNGHELKERIINHVGRVYNMGDNAIETFFDAWHDFNIEGRSDLRYIFEHIFKMNIPHMQIIIMNLTGPINEVLESTEIRALFKTEEDFERFKAFCYAPAAKGHHGAFIHGLLEHVNAMSKMCLSLKAIYEVGPSIKMLAGQKMLDAADSKIDFSLIRLACLIHDFYKTEEYVWGDLGDIDNAPGERMFHHDTRLAFDLQALKEKSGGAINDVLDKLTHMIMVHHGPWSDYKPSDRLKSYPESEILHLIDMLDSRIIGTLEK